LDFPRDENRFGIEFIFLLLAVRHCRHGGSKECGGPIVIINKQVNTVRAAGKRRLVRHEGPAGGYKADRVGRQPAVGTLLEGKGIGFALVGEIDR